MRTSPSEIPTTDEVAEFNEAISMRPGRAMPDPNILRMELSVNWRAKASYWREETQRIERHLVEERRKNERLRERNKRLSEEARSIVLRPRQEERASVPLDRQTAIDPFTEASSVVSKSTDDEIASKGWHCRYHAELILARDFWQRRRR